MIKLFLLFINFICVCFANTGDEYWQEFMDARRISPTLTAVQHLENLSKKVDGDNEATLKRKSNAILYFVTTGGKYGFANRTANDNERFAITNALTFATIASDQLANNTLGDIRSRYTQSLTDEIKTHLIEAQRIVTGTLVIGAYLQAGIEAQTKHQTPNYKPITMLFNDLFIEPYKQYYSPLRIAFQEWARSKDYFLNLLNKKFLTSSFIILNEFFGYNAHQFDPRQIQITDEHAEQVRQLIAPYLSYKPQLTHLTEEERNRLSDDITDYVEETKPDFKVKSISDGKNIFIYSLVRYSSLSRNTPTSTYSNMLTYNLGDGKPTDYYPPEIPAELNLKDLVHHLLYAAVYEPPHSW